MENLILMLVTAFIAGVVATYILTGILITRKLEREFKYEKSNHDWNTPPEHNSRWKSDNLEVRYKHLYDSEEIAETKKSNKPTLRRVYTPPPNQVR